MDAAPSPTTGLPPPGVKVPRPQYWCGLQNEAPRFQGRMTPAVAAEADKAFRITRPGAAAEAGSLVVQELQNYLDWANDPTWLLFWTWVSGFAFLACAKGLLWP